MFVLTPNLPVPRDRLGVGRLRTCGADIVISTDQLRYINLPLRNWDQKLSKFRHGMEHGVSTRPLVVITRPSGGEGVAAQDEFTQLLQQAGCDTLRLPLVRLERLQVADLSLVFEQVKGAEIIFFSSANGVRYLAESLRESGYEWQDLIEKSPLVLAQGPITARSLLSEFGYDAVLVPEVYTAAGIVRLLRQLNLLGSRIVHISPRGGMRLLSQEVHQAGGSVMLLELYKAVPAAGAEPELVAALLAAFSARRDEFRSKRRTILTFFSPSAVQGYANLVAALEEPLRAPTKGETGGRDEVEMRSLTASLAAARLVAFGPTTRRALEYNGFSVAAASDASSLARFAEQVARLAHGSEAVE